jgi:hypothetical protein
MIVYHGTTAKRARAICAGGFLPRKPSRRVWFAASKQYAVGRARCQARRAKDHPAVIKCDLNIDRLRRSVGKGKVMVRNGIIAIDGPVDVSVISTGPGLMSPRGAKEIARFFNTILGIKPWKGIAANHPGVKRIARWVDNRIAATKGIDIKPQELIELAERWIPEHFANVEVDPKTLEVEKHYPTIRVVAESSNPWVRQREDQALGLMDSPTPADRIHGLRLLQEIGDEDLADWCLMFVEDDALEVRLAAMKLLRECEGVNAAALKPLVRSDNLRDRGAALALLVQHDTPHRARWCERGLKDPAAHVRVQVARQLKRFDPKADRRLFEFALTDPNRQVAETAEKLTAHKGYARMRW